MIIGARAHNVEQAQTLAEKGFPLIEISVLSAATLKHDLKKLRLLKDVHDITFLAHGPEEGKAHDPFFLKNEMLPCIHRITDCLSELDIELLTVHFWLDQRFIEPQILDRKIEILDAMASHAAEHGVQLCVENLSEQAQDFARAFAAVKTLGMTLDIGHGELLCEKNTSYDFLAQYPEKIYHMHVHDNRGGNTQADDLHLLPGKGTIHFRSILKAVGRQGYNRSMTLEVVSESAVQGREYLQQMWNEVNPSERIAP